MADDKPQAETGFTVDQVRADELVEAYTRELTEWMDGKLPTILGNAEYGSRCAAVMIALNRQLGRIAAACGETQNVQPDIMADLVVSQFMKHHLQSISALHERAAMTLQ